jgi:hypothetical protein
MFSSVVFAAIFVGLLLASVVLWALFLRLGLHWAKVPEVTTRRVVLTTAIVIVLNVALNVVSLFVSPSSDAQSIALGLVELATAVLVPCAAISIVCKARFPRAFQAWLPTLLVPVMSIAFLILVLRPFLYEAFVIPTNAMAPTLLGKHWQGICSECGHPNYRSPEDERYALP